MITAETVNGIVRFQANGLPVVSLYCRVDPGTRRREVRARVDSLLDQVRALAKDRDLDHRYRLSARTDIERIKDALDSERWPPGTIAICDESRWLAASGDICPVCGKPTRYAPDVLDELAAAVIETGGSARQIAVDLMPDQYPTAAQLRFPPPPREAGPRKAGDGPA
jgi:hypothetical protein